MNTVIRYGLIGAGIYFGINWLADNPRKVDSVRNGVNNLVASTVDASNNLIDEVQK